MILNLLEQLCWRLGEVNDVLCAMPPTWGEIVTNVVHLPMIFG